MIGMRAADQRQDRALADQGGVSVGWSGCTATAVSPSIVSGRVVATDDECDRLALDRIADVPERCR